MSQLKGSEHLKIPLKDVEIATDNFEVCIGKGGYGWVYKGELFISGKHTTVAVKRLDESYGQGLKEFLTEIHLLSGQMHPNLISLLGYCDEGKERILVYEYAERGSLDRYIRGSDANHSLKWQDRLKICVDAARGLEYLHYHVGKHQSIIHRDIKSANILIDQNWVAKISDLGLSKLSFAGLNRSAAISRPCGTPGYCEPEYIISGIVKKESDVYSFGMVLFEVLCGRLCSLRDDDGFLLSAQLVKNYYTKNKLHEIVDPALRKQMSSHSLTKFSAIAYGCLLDDREQRPPMTLVVKELEELVKIIQQEDEEILVPHSEPVKGALALDGTQPAEGPQFMGQAEVVSTAENLAVDETQASRFTWAIKNFSSQRDEKLYSDVFMVGGYKWRVLVFPKGNNVDHLSLYLDVADSSTLPYGWSRYALFSLTVVDQSHNKFMITKDANHLFNLRESDWGFTSFMPLSDLYDPYKRYLVNDTIIIEADVSVHKVSNYNWVYDSKKETGFVGLKNQGETAYMNSLLQTLYHIPYFRKAVYHMPTENHIPSTSILLALQSIFYKLQYNETSVTTKELTKSFGWDAPDSFMQHDVQELNRVLCEKLEDRLKGTIVEGTIQKLFEGHHMNYIECINLDFKSIRKESFYDLQLDVKGCKDVYASFDKYVEVERLEGDDKYHAEGHGLQDARKAVMFIDFPPVLQLQLKRFEYDFMRDTMVKINDRYEFPLELDLDREDGKYLSPDADKGVRNLYTLHSVLVHSGDTDGGHYHAFIRPALSDQGFKFDDEMVTEEALKRALEEQYGCGEELPQTNPGCSKFAKHSNAYILVYLRKSDKEKIICDVDREDIAEHLRIKMRKEQEEKEDKRRYKARSRLYTIIEVVREVDLLQQIGKNIFFDLVDHDKVHSFRIKNQVPFNLFKEEVAKEFKIPVQFQRFWRWAKRQNHTYRPDCPLTLQEETQSVGELREVRSGKLQLFLEIETGLDLNSLAPPVETGSDILLFFKLYDPEKEELRFVGKSFVGRFRKPIEIVPKLNEMAGFTPDEEIELYEEVRSEPSVMCDRLEKGASYRSMAIGDGDIICFQKLHQKLAVEKYRYPDVPSFLEFVKNRQIVHFRSLGRPKEDDFCLELSKLHTYDDVVERMAQKLCLDDPSKIRLTLHNCYSQQPVPHAIKYRVADHLLDMLNYYGQISDILYYEVVDIPLPELQCLKTLRVVFHHATKEEPVIHNIRLPKQSTVGDVLNELKAKVELSHPNAELRLLEIFYHKIYKIFSLTMKIENINDQYWTLRAEEIPEEEKNTGPLDRLIHVYHFTNKTAQNQMQVQKFGEPFLLIIHKDETLADVKVRIQKKLRVPDDEFSKWKFAFISIGRPDYLQDSETVSRRFQNRYRDGPWEEYLGLEHLPFNPKGHMLHISPRGHMSQSSPIGHMPRTSPMGHMPRTSRARWYYGISDKFKSWIAN